MTNPSEDLLATTEGVDEGSRKSTTEGDPSTEDLTGVPNPINQALGERPGNVEAEPAPPVDMESGTVREDRASRAPGQQLEAGEG